ncbi:UNVERIFIED_ORG: hypothetical protein J3D58_000447 [Paenarthrobacter nicotinovorans]
MAQWLEADRTHQPLLQKFTCIAKADVGPGKWHKKRRDRPWARNVEAAIRGLRLPLKAPHRADVLLDAKAERINAFVAFRGERIGASEHHFLALYLARHLDCANTSTGTEAFEHFIDTCLELAAEMPGVELVVFAGQAHKLNTPIHSLLVEHGWEPEEEDDVDQDLVWWRYRVELLSG